VVVGLAVYGHLLVDTKVLIVHSPQLHQQAVVVVRTEEVMDPAIPPMAVAVAVVVTRKAVVPVLLVRVTTVGAD
jgi:hypothetical protein